jgi:hypothetical protein
MSERLQSFEAFWPFYLSQHADPTNRRLHYVGTTGTILCIGTGVLTLNPLWLLSAAICGYAFAWVGHFIIEKNRPATFTYPLWSLIADFRMYFTWLRGALGPELQKAGVGVAGAAS